MQGHIEAVTVNHNTSIYAELMLRSLFSLHRQDLDMAVTVLDNDSSDDTTALRSYPEEQGVEFVSTGLSGARRHDGNSHGENLSRFVQDHPKCDFYLFLDSDIVFLQCDTIDTMRDELNENGELFAIQARMSPDGKEESRAASWNTGGRENFVRRAKGRTEEQVAEVPAESYGIFRFVTGARVHPACCLVRNTATFRTVVALIGLSCAYIERTTGGTNYDTFGLMTQVMRTHGLRHELSSAMVQHFSGVSYNPKDMEIKREPCLLMLQRYRAESRSIT